MKRILQLVCPFIALAINGQTNCNYTTFPTDIYYPNSTTTPTNSLGFEYLCGPNTVVYDTIEYGCHFVYVNTNSTLFFKPTYSCAAASYVWLKNNSTLNLVQGAGPTFVFYEPGAIINNPFSVNISSYSCTSIAFPTINCTMTSITAQELNSTTMKIYPNPTNGKLNLEFTAGETKNIKLNLFNSLNQLVYSTDKPNGKQEIDLSFLPSGIYYLKIQNTSAQKVFKIIKE